MPRIIVKVSPKSDTAVDVDAIVARYTALGREVRRDGGKKRGRKRLALAVSAIVGGALVFVSGVPTALRERRAANDDGVGALRALVSTELDKLGAARAELAAERERYTAASAALERDLAAFAQRQTELVSQQAALTEQSTELRAALAAVEAQRVALLERAPDPGVERELAAIATQRRELEDRWNSFSSQGQRVSDELTRLEERRSALDDERAAMDQQRRELEQLIQSATQAAGTTSRIADPRLDPSLDPMMADAVDGSTLGEMRGGVQLANGMNIAIGLTRSASINGVEQYSSSLQLDDLAAGLDSAALAGIGTTVIQNGGGNFVSPGMLDGMSSGFGTIIQNSLDNQEIHTLSTYDIAISDVGSTLRDIATNQAISNALSLNQ